MADVTVTDNPSANRYEARIGGELAGVAQYRLSESVITFVHTEVLDGFDGMGVGSSLARSALDDVRARGERSVVAECEFIRGWIARHSDYADLLQGPARQP